MLITAALLIVAGVVAERFVGTGFLPEMDEGAFVLDYFTPGGTALAETDREIHIVERIARVRAPRQGGGGLREARTIAYDALERRVELP